MNKKLHFKNTVFFLCSPSLGLLDNWLPVIWQLKEQRKDLKFIIIFPKVEIIDQINLSNVLIILATKIFDSIVYKSHADHWLHSNTFSQLKATETSRGVEQLLLKIIKKLRKNQITRPLAILIQQIFKKLNRYYHRNELYDLKIAEKDGAFILFDLYEESKLYNIELLKYFNENPKFSIQHGININDSGVIDTTSKETYSAIRKNIKAYLFSSMEIPFYEKKYALDKSNMDVVGVPRHAPDWMKFIRSNIVEQNTKNDSIIKGSVFIISRPGNTKYHSYERKKKALEGIKRLVWSDLKKNIVVKLHPKEKNEGIYEEVFGSDSYGEKWVYSDLHPFILGKESCFAISFYSGVPIDMLALGIPTIEYLDLRGIPEYDNDESLRDALGHPVLSFRYLDLVLGASDYDQMRSHAIKIIKDRETVLSRLQAKYNELFPKIENINEKIAQDILNISKRYDY